MSSLKIAFFEPRTEKLNVFSRYNLPRLGSLILATILKKLGHKCQVYFIYEKEAYKLKADFDLVAISTITATAPQAYRLGDYFRTKKIPVIIGGPHVSFLPEEALQHADACVLGEAEETLPLLVDALNKQTDLTAIPNLVFLKEGKIFYTQRKPFSKPLDSLPFPDFSLINYGKAGFRHSLLFKQIIPIQTSRGCPYDCTFCSVTGMFGKRYRSRSTENIIQELKRYNSKKHKIFFYDDNFTANRRRIKDLLNAMIEQKLQFKWSTQVRAEIARDPELLQLMYKAGCRVLFIGFESVNPQALQEMKKSQTAEDIRHAIRIIQSYGIHVHGMFVFGFDTDTKASIRATIKFAIKERLDSAQFLILTPLPGSEFFNQMQEQNRIITKDWNKYDAHHVTFVPKNLSIFQLQLLQIEAHTRFYSPINLLRKFFHTKWLALFIGFYAHKLNQKWLKAEKDYLKALRNISQTFWAKPLRDEA